MKLTQIVAAVLAALVLQGCASSLSGNTYTRGEARIAQETRHGVVVKVRSVKIEGTDSSLGTITGAVAGAVLGSQIGGGTGQVIAGVAGALAGGVAGSAIEKTASSANGIELTVRLDGSNKEIVIVQEGKPGEFQVGQRVTVVSSGSSARVTP